jgi:hypothetical protein
MKYLALLLPVLCLVGCQEPAKPEPVAPVVAPQPVPEAVAVYGFYQANCAPCKQMYPQWRALTNFSWVNVKRQPVLALKYKVTSTPTTIFLDKDGNVIRRVEGYVEKL